jgi:hypothetical protein
MLIYSFSQHPISYTLKEIKVQLALSFGVSNTILKYTAIVYRDLWVLYSKIRMRESQIYGDYMLPTVSVMFEINTLCGLLISTLNSYRGSPTSMVSSSTNSTSTIFSAIVIKLVLKLDDS